MGLVAIATIPLLATSLQLPATASPAAGSGTDGARAGRTDDRSSALDNERRRLNQKAVRLVLNGERQVRTRSGSTAVRVEGEWAELGVQGSDRIFTTLVDFGERRDRKYKNAPAGPVHNEIPQPDRSERQHARTGSRTSTASTTSTCSSTAWLTRTASRSSGVYKEMSSGRFDPRG